jgi:hypothetical protein
MKFSNCFYTFAGAVICCLVQMQVAVSDNSSRAFSVKPDDACTPAIKIDAEGFFNRALTRLDMGDAAGAVTDVIESKKLNPQIVQEKQRQISDLLANAESQHRTDILVGRYLEQLALFDLADGKLDSADTLIKRAIRIQEHRLAEGDPRMTNGLTLLGRVELQKQSVSSVAQAVFIFRVALDRLRKYPDRQKYVIFDLEDCAKALMQSSHYEQAGSVLTDTRSARGTLGLTERTFTGDVARQADRALAAYRQKQQKEQQHITDSLKSVTSAPAK